MAERGGLAPHPGWRDDFLSRETRRAWPVRVPWSRRQDLHPHWTRSELVASALGYTGMLENGGPGRTCTVTFRVKAGCSGSLSYRAVRVEDAHPGLAPGFSVLQTDGSSLHRMRDSETGLTNRTCTGTAAFTGRDATVTTWSTLGNGAPAGTCTPNLRLRTAACILLHFGSVKSLALHAGAAPASAA